MTLVELMVSMLNISILEGMTISSFIYYLVSIRRSEAKTVMLKRNQVASFGYDKDAVGAALNASSLAALRFRALARKP